VLRPRGNDWLEDELRRMKHGGIDVLVSLLEQDEAEDLGLSEESKLAAEIGLAYLSFPIPDRHVPPNRAKFREFTAGLAAQLRAGKRIGVHCRGSIGRASITAACTLVQLGWRAELALKAIEGARGCSIPDTPEQREWILRFEAGL
jgi:protein-tyrosine phosphatase